MSRAAPVAIVAAAVALVPIAELDARKAKRGKVVRVERSRAGGKRLPRSCANYDPGTGNLICFGRPPRTGETATVVDETGTRATARVVAVTAQRDTCGNESQWNVQVEARTGRLDQVGYQALFLFDWELQRGARAMPPGTVPPNARPGEATLAAVDADGDGSADGFSTWFYCDASGTAQPYQYQQTKFYCVAHYARDGASFRETRLDIVAWCG